MYRAEVPQRSPQDACGNALEDNLILACYAIQDSKNDCIKEEV